MTGTAMPLKTSLLKGYANPPPAGCAIHCTGVHIWEKDKTLEFR